MQQRCQHTDEDSSQPAFQILFILSSRPGKQTTQCYLSSHTRDDSIAKATALQTCSSGWAVFGLHSGTAWKPAWHVTSSPGPSLPLQGCLPDHLCCGSPFPGRCCVSPLHPRKESSLLPSLHAPKASPLWPFSTLFLRENPRLCSGSPVPSGSSPDCSASPVMRLAGWL